MRGSEYADLRAFVMVVAQGSFARAAAQLGISPSTLSQTVKALEDRLGVRLLNRTTRSVSLTDAGRRLHARLVPAMADLQTAVEDVTSLRNTPAGTLRVCFTRLAATLFLEPILGDFHAAYPDIKLDIALDDSLADIVAGGFDLGVRMGERLEKDMVAVKLGNALTQLVVASPDYVKKHGAPATPADLHRHACINWRPPGSARLYEWVFQKKGQRFTVVVDGPMIVSDRSLAIAAAVQGIGITLAVEQRARALIEKGKLVSLLEPWRVSFAGWHLFYPRQRQVPASSRAFIDFLRKRAAEMPRRLYRKIHITPSHYLALLRPDPLPKLSAKASATARYKVRARKGGIRRCDMPGSR
jgi:DNA-binding transcriptional LysR family regulator